MGRALAIGFMFAALALRTGMIWPLVLIHFLTNFTFFISIKQLTISQITTEGLIILSIYMVVFVGYGVLLLAKGRPSFPIEA